MAFNIGSVLRRLGTIGKGFATIAGAVLGVAGVGTATASSDDVLKCMTTILSQPEGALIGSGALLFFFGVGRKAVWVAGGAKKK